MGFGTSCTNELATAMAEAGCNMLLALLTLSFLWLFDFLYDITNLKEMVEIKCSLEALNTSWWEEGGSTAAGTVKK